MRSLKTITAQKAVQYVVAASAAILLVGCGDKTSTFSLLADSQVFHQTTAQQLTKIDVLWVVDNSGSMASSQQNLTNNFPSFIQLFMDKHYDFQIATTTTDAYLADPLWTSYYNQNPKPSYFNGGTQAEMAHFRDGHPGQPSGYRILTPELTNLNSLFLLNALQGINGRGDERAFASFKSALSSPLNAGFPRSDSFLAVITIGDEDDFSHNGTALHESYDSTLDTIDSYVSFLDTLTGTSGATRRYSVSTIAVDSQACLNAIYNGAQKIGVRYGQIADATGGVKGSICGDFSQELAHIADSIVQLSTQFFLHGDPEPTSIKVIVNGVQVPSAAGNPTGGWTYNATANSILFSGAYIPSQNSTIQVTFDPKKIIF